MTHKCTCFTGAVMTWVNISSEYWFTDRWNIIGHDDDSFSFYCYCVHEKSSSMIPPSFYWKRQCKIPLNSTWWWVTVPQISKQCNYMVLDTAGNSAPSLPLTMLDKQRLPWAYLIKVHHAASFIRDIKKTISEWLIPWFTTCERISGLC